MVMSGNATFNLASLFPQVVAKARPEAKVKEYLDGMEVKIIKWNSNHDDWDHLSKIIERLSERGDEFSPSEKKRLMTLITKMHDGMVHHAPMRHIFRVIASWKEAIEPLEKESKDSFFDIMMSKGNMKGKVKIKTAFLIALVDVAPNEQKGNWEKYLIQFATDVVNDPIIQVNLGLKGFLSVVVNGVIPKDEEFVPTPAPRPELEPKEGDDDHPYNKKDNSKKGNAYRNGKNHRRGGIPDQKYSYDTGESQGQGEVVTTIDPGKSAVKLEETPAGQVLRQLKGGGVTQITPVLPVTNEQVEAVLEINEEDRKKMSEVRVPTDQAGNMSAGQFAIPVVGQPIAGVPSFLQPASTPVIKEEDRLVFLTPEEIEFLTEDDKETGKKGEKTLYQILTKMPSWEPKQEAKFVELVEIARSRKLLKEQEEADDKYNDLTDEEIEALRAEGLL
jgi:hypothetical protein